MNDKYVSIKVNAEKGEGKDLRQEFEANGFPTAVIVDPKTRKEIDRLVGFQPPEAYVKALKEIAAGNSFAALAKKVKDDPKDLEAWSLYAEKLEGRNKLDEAAAAWKKVQALDPSDAKGKGARAEFALVRIQAMKTRSPDPVIAFAKKYDGKPAALEAHQMLVQVLGGAPGDEEETKQVLASYEYLVTHGKRDPETLNGYAWTLATGKKDLEKALKMAQEALKQEPKSSQIMDTVAECLFQLGKKDEALAMEKKAIDAADDPNLKKFLEKRLADMKGGATGEKDG